SVAFSEFRLIGCGALHFYTPTSGEVRSLAVHPAIQSRGLGRRIVEALEQEAADNGLRALFAFTYVPQFFAKLGFSEVERGVLPLKAWKDCLRCPKFQNCDEIAVLKRLKAPISGHLHRQPSSIPVELVQLPHVGKPTSLIR